MHRITIDTGSSTSHIVISSGAYAKLDAHLKRSRISGPLLVVTQPRVLEALDAGPLRGREIALLPDGERAKTLTQVRRLIDRMVELRLTRQSGVIALGGGVVGDVAGFAAALYLRGIPLVQVPTTLLAQVDSSVGGKTAVNHPAGKNLIGAFHQPKLVVVDPSLLASLPHREYRCGLYEALKYGLIRDRRVFEQFIGDLEPILERNPRVLDTLITRCLQVKADIVEADEREGNLRRVLNFGHTIGHGLETAAGYRRIRHGEAVGYGMIAAARLSERLGRLSSRAGDRIETAIRSIGPLPSLAGISADDVVDALAHDKKVRNGSVHFVLLRGVGRTEIRANVPRAMVRKIVETLVAG